MKVIKVNYLIDAEENLILQSRIDKQPEGHEDEQILKHHCGVVIFFKIYFIYLFLERGQGKEKERKRNINVWLPLACSLLRTWPATQACALTGNPTSNLLVHRPVLNPLSHSSQGHCGGVTKQENITREMVMLIWRRHITQNRTWHFMESTGLGCSFLIYSIISCVVSGKSFHCLVPVSSFVK